MKVIAVILGFLGLVAGGVLPAQAAPGYCSLDGATHGIGAGNLSLNGVQAADCYAVVTGDNINKVGQLDGLLWTSADNPWVQIAQSNRVGGRGETVSAQYQGMLFTTAWTGGKSGEWTLDVSSANPAARFGGQQHYDLALALKGANSYALWFFDNVQVGALNAGTWEVVFATAGNPKRPNIPDLSHISLFVRQGSGDTPPPSNEVPAPATPALLGIGLLGLLGASALRRRRR